MGLNIISELDDLGQVGDSKSTFPAGSSPGECASRILGTCRSDRAEPVTGLRDKPVKRDYSDF